MSEKGKIIRIAQEGFEINSRTYLDDFDEIIQNAGTKVQIQSDKNIVYGERKDDEYTKLELISLTGPYDIETMETLEKVTVGNEYYFIAELNRAPTINDSFNSIKWSLKFEKHEKFLTAQEVSFGEISYYVTIKIIEKEDFTICAGINNPESCSLKVKIEKCFCHR